MHAGMKEKGRTVGELEVARDQLVLERGAVGQLDPLAVVGDAAGRVQSSVDRVRVERMICDAHDDRATESDRPAEADVSSDLRTTRR